MMLADDAQLRKWIAQGQKIGSPGVSHRSLAELSRADARCEIVDSRKMLEDRFGEAISDFCYPYGAVNEVIQDLAAEAGYRTACTTRPGVNLRLENPFLLKRTAVQHRRPWLAAVCPGPLSPWC